MTPLRTVFSFLVPYRRSAVLALLATIVFTGLNLLPPQLMEYLVDHVLRENQWQLVWALALAITAVPVLAAVVRLGNAWILMFVGNRVIADLRLAMYRKIMFLEMQYHTRASTGATVSRLMEDVNRVQRMLTDDTVGILVDVVVFVFSMGYVFYKSFYLGCTLLVFVAMYAGVYRVFSRRIHRSTLAFRELYDQIAGRLSETVTGVRQVRIYNREDRENEMFLDRTARSLDKALASRMGSVSLGVTCSGIAGFGSTVILALGAYFVIKGRMTLGEIVAINSYVWLAISPAIRLTQIAGSLTETMVSVDRIVEVLDTEQDIASPPDAPQMVRGAGEVEFRDVTFSYDPAMPLYEGLSLKADAGKTIALVGPTGCGKTTFTSLLMRYWDVVGGQVLVDGVDVRTVDLRSLRKLFGVVLQDPLVFAGTLAENIAYGRPDATREAIIAVARAAEIHETALALPDGFDTVIGPDGVKLSVGERQRLSIARTILIDPLILVMDEATSSLDSLSEALIQKALARVLVGRTSFVVAHRLSTITAADTIVVMDRGRIVETGTHEELLAIDNGLYGALYEEMLGQSGEGAP